MAERYGEFRCQGANHRTHGAQRGNECAVYDEIDHRAGANAPHKNGVPPLGQHPLGAHHIGKADHDQGKSQGNHQDTGIGKVRPEKQGREFRGHGRHAKGHGTGHAEHQLHGKGHVALYRGRFSADVHGGHLGQHDGADGGDKSAEAVNDLLGVFIQAVFRHAADGANHDFVHGAVYLHRNHRQEQHRAGPQMPQGIAPGHGMKTHLPLEPNPAAEAANQRTATPDESIAPQILLAAHQQKHAGRCHELYKGVAQGNGPETVQPHEQPVQVDQTADGHQG